MIKLRRRPGGIRRQGRSPSATPLLPHNAGRWLSSTLADRPMWACAKPLLGRVETMVGPAEQ
jgi:hypothetical protein